MVCGPRSVHKRRPCVSSLLEVAGTSDWNNHTASVSHTFSVQGPARARRGLSADATAYQDCVHLLPSGKLDHSSPCTAGVPGESSPLSPCRRQPVNSGRFRVGNSVVKLFPYRLGTRCLFYPLLSLVRQKVIARCDNHVLNEVSDYVSVRSATAWLCMHIPTKFLGLCIAASTRVVLAGKCWLCHHSFHSGRSSHYGTEGYKLILSLFCRSVVAFPLVLQVNEPLGCSVVSERQYDYPGHDSTLLTAWRPIPLHPRLV